MDDEAMSGTGVAQRLDVTVGFDASAWTSEQLIAFVTRSPQRVALDHVSEGLNGLGLPAGVVDAMLAVVTSAAAHQGCSNEQDGARGEAVTARVAPVMAIGDAAVLAAAHGARVLQGFAEGALIDTARTLADRAGAELLARRGLCDPAELCPTKREKWRGRTKSLVAQELSVLTGHGIQAAHMIVGFALAPPAAVAASSAALRAGKTNWRAVSAFWARCRTFEATAAAEVDQAVFGPLLAQPTPEGQTEHPDPAVEMPDTDVETPDSETPDSEDGVGEATGQDQRCESWAEFSRRLEREAVRAESADAAQARAKRREAHARRDVQARIGDQGSGEVILTGSTTCVAGAVERIEAIARAAKAVGDPRSLGQIRSDSAFALLVHGILPLPGTCGGACPAHTDATDTTSAAFHGSTPGTGRRPEGSAAGSVSTAEPLIETPEDIHRIITGQPATHVEVIVPASFLTDPDTDTDTTVSGDEPDPPADAGGDADPPSPDPAPCQQRPRRQRSGGVAEIVGYGFLSGEHARELVATPGSTLHRLLTDPADGRLLERTITAYRPDAAMITQLRAADVCCRAPGCLVPARRCDIDHEQEYDQGGPTAETNLGNKHRPHHQVKTAKFWATMMNSTRQVTWRTLFGRMYTTRPHDYNQYDKPPVSPRPDSTPDSSTPDGIMVEGSRAEGWGDPLSLTDPDTRNQLIYAALSTRTGMDQWLEAIDDDEDAWRYGSERPLTLFHHTDGRRRPGPPPGQPGPDEFMNPTPRPTPNQDPPPF